MVLRDEAIRCQWLFFHRSFQVCVKSRIWRWKCGFFSWVFSGNGNMSSEKVHAKFCFHFDGRFPARCYHLHICMALRPSRFSWTRYTRKVWNVSHTVRWSIQVFRSATWRRCGILTAINWKTFITIRKTIDHSTQKRFVYDHHVTILMQPSVLCPSFSQSLPFGYHFCFQCFLQLRLRSGSLEPLRQSWFCWCHCSTDFR